MQIDPYRFHGDWTDDEKQTVLDTLFAHTPRKVGASSYNLWHFTKHGGTSCTALRDEWIHAPLYGSTAQELADELHHYYIE